MYILPLFILPNSTFACLHDEISQINYTQMDHVSSLYGDRWINCSLKVFMLRNSQDQLNCIRTAPISPTHKRQSRDSLCRNAQEKHSPMFLSHMVHLYLLYLSKILKINGKVGQPYLILSWFIEPNTILSQGYAVFLRTKGRGATKLYVYVSTKIEVIE